MLSSTDICLRFHKSLKFCRWLELCNLWLLQNLWLSAMESMWYLQLNQKAFWSHSQTHEHLWFKCHFNQGVVARRVQSLLVSSLHHTTIASHCRCDWYDIGIAHRIESLHFLYNFFELLCCSIHQKNFRCKLHYDCMQSFFDEIHHFFDHAPFPYYGIYLYVYNFHMEILYKVQHWDGNGSFSTIGVRFLPYSEHIFYIFLFSLILFSSVVLQL